MTINNLFEYLLGAGITINRLIIKITPMKELKNREVK